MPPGTGSCMVLTLAPVAGRQDTIEPCCQVWREPKEGTASVATRVQFYSKSQCSPVPAAALQSRSEARRHGAVGMRLGCACGAPAGGRGAAAGRMDDNAIVMITTWITNYMHMYMLLVDHAWH